MLLHWKSALCYYIGGVRCATTLEKCAVLLHRKGALCYYIEKMRCATTLGAGHPRQYYPGLLVLNFSN